MASFRTCRQPVPVCMYLLLGGVNRLIFRQPVDIDEQYKSIKTSIFDFLKAMQYIQIKTTRERNNAITDFHRTLGIEDIVC